MIAREDAHQIGRRAQPLGEVHVVGAGRGIAAYALLRMSGVMRTPALCAAVSAIARRRRIPAAVRPHDQAAAEVAS